MTSVDQVFVLRQRDESLVYAGVVASLIWLVAAILLVAAEAASGDFFLLMLGGGALAAAGVSARRHSGVGGRRRVRPRVGPADLRGATGAAPKVRPDADAHDQRRTP